MSGMNNSSGGSSNGSSNSNSDSGSSGGSSNGSSNSDSGGGGYLAMCLVVRDEGPYLLEWIDHYLRWGGGD